MRVESKNIRIGLELPHFWSRSLSLLGEAAHRCAFKFLIANVWIERAYGTSFGGRVENHILIGIICMFLTVTYISRKRNSRCSLEKPPLRSGFSRFARKMLRKLVYWSSCLFRGRPGTPPPHAWGGVPGGCSEWIRRCSEWVGRCSECISAPPAHRSARGPEE